jgi:hypothetical protein
VLLPLLSAQSIGDHECIDPFILEIHAQPFKEVIETTLKRLAQVVMRSRRIVTPGLSMEGGQCCLGACLGGIDDRA